MPNPCRCESNSTLCVRPYQLLCVVCAAGGNRAAARRRPIATLASTIRQHPDRPLSLVCNAGGVYQYQDPGLAADWPRGKEFNRKRDLDILQALNWPPGITLPARTIFTYLMHTIPGVATICGHAAARDAAWKGCPYALSGFYEKVIKDSTQPNNKSKIVQNIIPPRSPEEMEREKRVSLKALMRAKVVHIRPHLLLCAVCQYGGGARPPFKADNVPDLIQLLLTRKTDVKIKLVPHADWMMCAPCALRVPGLNACVNSYGSGGLSNEKRDLDVLLRLELHYGSVVSGRRLYRLLFERFPDVEGMCLRDPATHPASVWWDGCITTNYAKGRKELMRLFGFI